MKRFFTKLFFIEILLYRIVVYFVRLFFWGGGGEVAGRVTFFDFADIQKCKTFSDKIVSNEGSFGISTRSIFSGGCLIIFVITSVLQYFCELLVLKYLYRTVDRYFFDVFYFYRYSIVPTNLNLKNNIAIQVKSPVIQSL